ncbi:phytoene desaturase family protein [Mucilaginibacter sp. RS28]|uniref:Phytoene desaturase family protein n=1 Tax=Mucilaginibacter straminoryzae TaxID=2932774 RepID=A0A9X1X027_9SPHI|nr:1-hydroxycarotenoid 3,4-desaturase CrtD [Mucilaginibacter straminoryzae]MCJ8208777.1 phytoene desaturase family protein [Mucilaginibacter straminoryzae]
MSEPKAIVIGAGIAGIATAIRLKVRGFEVQVFEANHYPGGKLSEFEQEGYRFDAGPSLFTMPQYVDELFSLAGKNPRDYFNYQQLDTVCEYFYEDGRRFTACADLKDFVRQVKLQTNDTERAATRFAANSRRIYQITSHVFLEKSLHRLSTYLNFKTLWSLLKVLRIDPFRTMHRANKCFFKDVHMTQYADRYATYNGSDPYQAPATLNVIPYLEQHFGAWFPKGGMYAITTSLVKLAEQIGVKFHYSSPVDEVILDGKKAAGVRVQGKSIAADIVVSNMDVWFTYHRLLKNYPDLKPRKILRQERSSSALIFYLGIGKKFPDLDLHNIFFSKDYSAEFNAIWKHKTISSDPTVYVNISSKYKPDDAPDGHENWFVMINVPSDEGQDWNRLIADARVNIIRKLSRILGEDIGSLVTCESILDPRSIEQKTSSFRGSLYGTSSNNRFAAFLRHANRSSKVKNLYFCGGSVHPGGGIPLALLSAKIVSDWIP